MYKYIFVLCVVYYVTAMDIYTKSSADYKFFPVTKTAVHFKVKTEQEALVALTTKALMANPMIEILIGGWKNTNNVIRRKFRSVPDKVTVETPGILSGTEFRAFWVSWDGGVISVGREGTDEPFMSWTDPNPFPIAFVGVRSSGANGSWIVEESPFDPVKTSHAYGDVVIGCRGYIHTESKAVYKFFPIANTSLHFKVKAASNAHVALTTGPQPSDLIVEVLIGGWNNTNSVIRRLYRSVPTKVTVETPGILSGCELRGFWVSWDGGIISVGRERTEAPFMTWLDPNPFPITYVGVRTNWGANGFWIIQYIYTKSKAGYTFLPVSNTTCVSFKVKAREEALIALTTGPQISDPTIEILIGGWTNTNNLIRRKFKTIPEKVTVETPGILSGSEFRGFWVSWDGGIISVGCEGFHAPFMSWADPEPFHIAYVGVSSWASDASWKIADFTSTTSAPNDVIASCKGHNAGYTFLPVSNTTCLWFKVKAREEALIALTTGPQISDPTIEVVIGGWINTNSMIRLPYTTVPAKVSVETPRILSSDEFRGFWISWDGGVILVGREGSDTPFMSWADPKPFHITYVGVHTGYGATGSWIFGEAPSAPETAPRPSSSAPSRDDVIYII